MEPSSHKTADILKYLGFDRSADLRSYLHLRGFIQVLGLKSLVSANTMAFCVREYSKSSEIFVNTGEGVYLMFKYDGLDKLDHVQSVKDLG